MFIKTDQQLLGTYMWYMLLLDTCYCADESFEPDPVMQEAYEKFMGICGDFQHQVEKHLDTYLNWRNDD